MAGQGRNADGHGNGAEPLNVVRFPGDWFGPLEDLVPIGQDAEEERRNAGPEDLQPPLGPDADSFWGENAEAVHRVAETPTAPYVAPRRSWLRRALVPGVGLAAVLGAVVLAVGSGSAEPKRSEHHVSSRVELSARTQPSRVIGNALLAAAESAATTHPVRVRRRPTANHRHKSVPSTGATDISAERSTLSTAPTPTPQALVQSPSGLVAPPPNAPPTNP